MTKLKMTAMNVGPLGGAKNLLVLGVPDLGKTPDVTQGLADGSNMPSAAPDGSRTASRRHREPSQRTATGAVVPCIPRPTVSVPTATQEVADTHDTALR